ncbi:uncharacterized protein LAESUDRAFT_729684 [Laetiporus sulphureus 93-53]|uniref:Spindle pole body component n=1 Tax=Laetiporus sulphureus 93-53 TaxID=1314785 RepID=A0A165CJC6_9APHY|nr:uncharacterized protein LAESUDRAFT_729684 [Laetiporus sulphureus 93-53]KZT02915.1 hypothetical protein LAESUDRAFT_729684 [Laetiporus sulphureus 93-53]
MEPYTPRRRKKNLTLSTKEYTKVWTIASVRRTHQYVEDGYEEDPGVFSASPEETSFYAETSFVRAPLNSRDKSKGKGKTKAKESFEGVPLEVQEALVLEDLLFVLMAIEGVYVTQLPDYSPDDEDPLQGIAFVVSPSLNPSLRDLVERILPFATYYTAVTSFIELRSHSDFGLVNHVLCAAMRDMLKHLLLIHPAEALFYVHPILHTLSLLYLLTTELARADGTSDAQSESESESSVDSEEAVCNEALGLGGAKLKAMRSEINKGVDEGASATPVKGGEPYIEMLQAWILMGRLVDPYEELCVKESKFVDREMLEVDYTDEYWERRYTVNHIDMYIWSRDGSTIGGSSQTAGVPPPRTPGGRLPGGACNWKHKMLLAGKYLNVIRECGIEIRRYSNQADDDLSLDNEKLDKSMDEAYTHANHTLLELLLRDQQLIPRLRSSKRLFFLSQSTFITHLLDLSHSELRRPAKGASLVKLQSLLDLVLNTNTQGEDAMFREDVCVTMAMSGLYEWLIDVLRKHGSIWLTGMGYTVKFPLSLVISRKTVLRYQLIFHFLLHLKHVEQMLTSMWLEQKMPIWHRTPPRERVGCAAGRTGASARSCCGRACLRSCNNILAFTTFEVLEPNWRKLEGKLEARKVETVNQLLKEHVDVLDTCLKECMLNSSRLLGAYSRLMTTCLIFALYAASFTKSLNGAFASEKLTVPVNGD